MSLMAKDTGGGDFELIPADNHPARCYMVCDLGEHETEYQGVKSTKRQVRISFECPMALMSEGDNIGRPFSISKEYTLSLSDKAKLCEHLTGWRGKAFTDEEKAGFDLMKLIGVPALVNVVHKVSGNTGKPYAVIQSISRMPQGLEIGPAVNLVTSFSLETDDADKKFEALPEWLQKKVNRNLAASTEAEYDQVPPAGPDAFDSFDDDIPF